MLLLNHPLLTSLGILAIFEQNILNKAHRKSIKIYASLRQLKDELKIVFFGHIDKDSSDFDLIYALQNDARFTSNYLQLKHILMTLFSSTDTTDLTYIQSQLLNCTYTDWDMHNAHDQFATLNTRYGYFDPHALDAIDLFIKLAIGCRTMIVLFEKNNTSEDTMAYDYAYKLMALFADPSNLNTHLAFNAIAQEAYNLLMPLEHKRTKPFHDILLFRLLLPEASDLSDKAGWLTLVRKEGYQALPFLSIAKKMEQKIALCASIPPRAPDDLIEAQTIADLCCYDRANSSNKDFAQLCYRYKIPEARFNACLDYLERAPKWPKKTQDTVPDLVIKGEGEAHGLYWLKLPATDKRALILGDITNCCESIGGKGEACVLDALSLNDNAHYVLLKQKSHTSNPCLLSHDGEINDTEFDIIGQAYVWKSQTGNICLDSLEVVNNIVSESALKSLMLDFATKLLQMYQDIKFVTLGTGGQTPHFSFNTATIAEKMRQGHDYGDAVRQFIIATSPYSTLSEPSQSALETLLETKPYFPQFKRCIRYLSHYIDNPDHFVDQLTTLLQTHPSFAQDLTEISLFNLLSTTPTPTFNHLMPTCFKQHLMIEEDCIEPISGAIKPNFFKQILEIKLKKASVVTQESDSNVKIMV